MQIEHDDIRLRQLCGLLKDGGDGERFSRARAAQQRGMALEKLVAIDVGTGLAIQGIGTDLEWGCRILLG